MKPYLYILAVLLVGGGIGFFLGQRTSGPGLEGGSVMPSQPDDRKAIEALLGRVKEAYEAHDELLLHRDCSANYVEINATTGESFDLAKSIIRYHELFLPGKQITIILGPLDLTAMHNAALVRTTYSKTSDQFERQGFSALTGQVLWLMSKMAGKWEIAATVWAEERKR